MEILKTDKGYDFCSFTKRRSSALQRHCIARTTTEKAFIQVFNIWVEYSKAIQW